MPDTADTAARPEASSPLSGGGEMGALMRSIDWSSTAVGPHAGWPAPLKTAVRILLDCRLPMYVAWGPDFTQFYNDAYRSVLGNKHPHAMGTSAKDTWPEIWSTIGPMWAEVLQGKSFGFDDFKLTINRYGYAEDCYFNFSYSPVTGDDGRAAGVLVTFAETTEKVAINRRQVLQLEIADTLRRLSDPREIMANASRLLGRHLRASRVLYGDVDSERDLIHFHSSHTDGTVSDLTGPRPLGSFGGGNLVDIAQGRTVVYDDVTLDARTNDTATLHHLASYEIRSGIGVPIIRGGVFRAALCVHHREPRHWTAEDVALVEDVADRTWHAVERARAEAESKRHISALQQLNQVAESVHAELRLDPLLQAVTDAARSVSGAQFGAFFHNVVNAEGESYMLYAISGVPREAFSRFPMPRNTAVFGPTFDGHGIRRSDDITQDPDYGKNAPYHGMPPGHLPVRSYLAVPVRSRGGEVFGGLFLGHREPGRFTAEHEYLVRGIAVQAAIGIMNSRLYESAQKLLEAERRARTDAERESRLKEEFLNTLSHELRTPLNAIIGWSELLRVRRGGDAEIEKALAVIERNANAQAKIINDLLDMSRIASGNVHLDLAGIDMAQLIDAAIDSVKPAAAAKHIGIRQALDRENAMVRGDSVRLHQVLWNLLTNAIKFTPEGGLVDVGLARNGACVDITVTDSGHGIAAEFLPFVFDRFRQADGSVARKYGGLGLGLAIVKSLVDLHGGRIEAKSGGEGQGATFVLSLPAIDGSDARQAGTAASALPDIAGVKVLVVDDEPDSLSLMHAILANAGAVVATASNAREALERIAHDRPDVLLSDIGMPVEDGYMLMRAVRTMERDKGLPLLPAAAVTAFAREEDVRNASDAGYQLHLPKPVYAVEIIHTVHRLARR